MLFCIANNSKHVGPDIISMVTWDQWFYSLCNINDHGRAGNVTLHCARKVMHEQEPLDFHNKGQVSEAPPNNGRCGKSLNSPQREASSERPPLAFIKVDTT